MTDVGSCNGNARGRSERQRDTAFGMLNGKGRVVRFVLILTTSLLLAITISAGAVDTPKAVAAREKFRTRLSVQYKDTPLVQIKDDLMDRIEKLPIILDLAGGDSPDL